MINREAFQNNLARLRRMEWKIAIEIVGQNRFMFSFPSAQERGEFLMIGLGTLINIL